MTLRTAFVVALLALTVGTADAQQQTGEIFGRATDGSGAVLPGATVTVSGPALLQPRVATTSETGSYRLPELPIGTYSGDVRAAWLQDSSSARTCASPSGSRRRSTPQLELSSVQETVTVTGESPLVDTKATGTKTIVRPRVAAEPAVGARPLGHARDDARHHDGPRQRRRQPVRPAVRLHLARRRAPATTSGRSTASTSPTCRRPARRRSTTTSTCSRRCR